MWARRGGDSVGNEKGFTLIELFLVVLILGILMSIAIPTFLSLTKVARATGPESNLAIAAADEAAYFELHLAYGTSVSSPSMAALDSGINWATCSGAQGQACIADAGQAKDVYVLPVADGAYNAVVLGAAGTDQKDYWELESQNPTTTSPEYEVTASAVPPTVAAFEAASKTTWAAAGG